MLFLVYSIDNPKSGKETRRKTRTHHLKYVRDHKDMVIYGGSLLGSAGEMIGTLQIVEAADRPTLDRFLENDPYNKASLFEKIVINETRQSLPEAFPGQLDAEIVRAAELGGA
ncbi:MAG: YciI family protein [Bradyrhizobium sp.]